MRIKIKKRGRHRATGLTTRNRARRGKGKSVALAPPLASPANDSYIHPKTWCQVRVLISDALPMGHGCGVSGRVSASAFGGGGGERKTRCQARILAPGETPEYPEWVGMVMAQSAGNVLVTRVENARYRVGLATDTDAGCRVRTFETSVPNEGFHPWGGPLVCRFQGPLAPWNPVTSVLPHAGLRRRPQPAGRRPAPPRSRPHSEMCPLEMAVALPWPSSAPIAEPAGGGQRIWCQARVLASVETPEYPEWVWMVTAQDAGDEMVTRDKNASFKLGVGGTSALTPALSRSGEGEFSAASVRCGSQGLSCGDMSPKTSATGCHGGMPWGDYDGFLRLVSDRTPGACSGSGCDFVLEDIGGEMVMRRSCPEIAHPRMRFSRGNSPRRRPAADRGVAAKPTDWYRPCRAEVLILRLPWVSRGATHGYSNGIPPGCTVAGRLKLPEPGCGFSSEDAGGEMLTWRDCPEIGAGAGTRRGGVKAVPMHRDRSPSPGGITACLQDNGHLGRLRRGVNGVNGVNAGLVGMRKGLEWGCGFGLHDSVGEWVMTRDCPEIERGKAKG